MAYLLGEIVLCLILALVLGWIIGWSLRGVRSRGDLDEMRTQLQRNQALLIETKQRAEILEESLAAAQSSSLAEQSRLKETRIRNLESYEAEIVWLRQELKNTATTKNKQIDTLRARLETLGPLNHERKVRDTHTQAEANNPQLQQLEQKLFERNRTIRDLQEQLERKRQEWTRELNALQKALRHERHVATGRSR